MKEFKMKFEKTIEDIMQMCIGAICILAGAMGLHSSLG